jgi:hypothetical protein
MKELTRIPFILLLREGTTEEQLTTLLSIEGVSIERLTLLQKDVLFAFTLVKLQEEHLSKFLYSSLKQSELIEEIL